MELRTATQRERSSFGGMQERADPGALTVRSLAVLLAPTLTWEKSLQVVGGAVERLGFCDGQLRAEDGEVILRDLAIEQGIVGVAARWALTRRGKGEASISAEPALGSVRLDGRASSFLAVTIGVHEVTAELTPLLGPDKSEPAVVEGIKRLGLPRDRLDREQTIQLLDDLARRQGHVGSTVRFTRQRILARFGG